MWNLLCPQKLISNTLFFSKTKHNKTNKLSEWYLIYINEWLIFTFPFFLKNLWQPKLTLVHEVVGMGLPMYGILILNGVPLLAMISLAKYSGDTLGATVTKEHISYYFMFSKCSNFFSLLQYHFFKELQIVILEYLTLYKCIITLTLFLLLTIIFPCKFSNICCKEVKLNTLHYLFSHS